VYRLKARSFKDDHLSIPIDRQGILKHSFIGIFVNLEVVLAYDGLENACIKQDFPCPNPILMFTPATKWKFWPNSWLR
jgi:hypothetical protein